MSNYKWKKYIIELSGGSGITGPQQQKLESFIKSDGFYDQAKFLTTQNDANKGITDNLSKEKRLLNKSRTPKTAEDGFHSGVTGKAVDAGVFDRWWRPSIIDLQEAAKTTAQLALQNKITVDGVDGRVKGLSEGSIKRDDALQKQISSIVIDVEKIQREGLKRKDLAGLVAEYLVNKQYLTKLELETILKSYLKLEQIPKPEELMKWRDDLTKYIREDRELQQEYEREKAKTQQEVQQWRNDLTTYIAQDKADREQDEREKAAAKKEVEQWRLDLTKYINKIETELRSKDSEITRLLDDLKLKDANFSTKISNIESRITLAGQKQDGIDIKTDKVTELERQVGELKNSIDQIVILLNEIKR